MWRLRNIKDTVERVVFNFTEVEVKLREITNDEPWGPTGDQLRELTELSFHYACLEEIMRALWERIQNPHSSWRNVYKSLVVIDHLLKFGSTLVTANIEDHRDVFYDLKRRSFIDDDKRDRTINVHQRVKEISRLVENKQVLEEEREKARDYKKRVEKNSSVESDYSAYQSQLSKDKKGFLSTLKETISLDFSSGDTRSRRSQLANMAREWEDNELRSTELWKQKGHHQDKIDEVSQPGSPVKQPLEVFPLKEEAPDLLDFSTDLTVPHGQKEQNFDPFASSALPSETLYSQLLQTTSVQQQTTHISASYGATQPFNNAQDFTFGAFQKAPSANTATTPSFKPIGPPLTQSATAFGGNPSITPFQETFGISAFPNNQPNTGQSSFDACWPTTSNQLISFDLKATSTSQSNSFASEQPNNFNQSNPFHSLGFQFTPK